jgi:hypothetical protein
MAKHEQKRSERVKHFFTDIFTGDQISRCLTRQEPCIYDVSKLPSEDMIKVITSRYENMTFDTIIPRTNKDIDKCLKETMIDLNVYDKNGLGIVGEHGKITD